MNHLTGLIAALKSGDYWCALKCALHLAAELAGECCHEGGMKAAPTADATLAELTVDLERVAAPKAATGFDPSVLWPILLAVLQRLLEVLRK